MKCLFLDLASNKGFLACVADTETVRSEAVDHRISDNEVIPLIEKMLDAAGWKIEEVDHLACVTGPGGFTSLRVGVALANALASGLKIPITGIHLSDLYAARLKKKDAIWIHSTKKSEVFVRGFGKFATLWPEAIHLPLQEALKAFPVGAGLTGELIPEHEKLFHENAQTLPPLALEEILPAFLKTCDFTKATLEPWYGRMW